VEYTVTFSTDHSGVLYAQDRIGPVRIAEFKRISDHWTFKTLGTRIFYTIGYDVFEACTAYLRFIGERNANVQYPLKPAA